MKYRKLRIAFSAVCGIVCLLLIALWVRSYWWAPYLRVIRSKHSHSYVLIEKGILLGRFGPSAKTTSWTDYGQLDVWSHNRNFDYTWFGFYFGGDEMFPGFLAIDVPFWFIVPATAMFGYLPWLPFRFSLRTLLIGMTLVAALLGAVVWAAR